MADYEDYDIQVALVEEQKAEKYMKSSCFKHIFEVNYLAHFWAEIISNWDTEDDHQLVAMQHEMLEWLRIMIESGTLVPPFDTLPEPQSVHAQPPISFEVYTRETIRAAILESLAQQDPAKTDKTLLDIYAKRMPLQREKVKTHLGQAMQGMQELGLQQGEEIRRQLIKQFDYPLEPVKTEKKEIQIVREDILTE